MSGKGQPNDHPHIGLAVLAAGAMALALAAGLGFLGIIQIMDGLLARFLTPKGIVQPSTPIAPAILWGGSALLAFLLPAVILNIPGLWRRLLVWALTFALTLAWGPVLILAAHKPEISVALITVLWSGFCAMFYTTNHVLPADTPHLDHGPS